MLLLIEKGTTNKGFLFLFFEFEFVSEKASIIGVQ